MKITLRSDSVHIEGYVNAVGRDSRRLRDEYGNEFVEQIQPGTFALALSKNADPVHILHNHKEDRDLGSTETNLVLSEDSIGLYAIVDITDEQIIEKARDNKLVGWSFGFIPLDCRVTYDYDNHLERRIITELDLKEVSIIDDTMLPCYAGTSVHSRAEMNIRAMDSDIIRTIEIQDTQPRAESIEEEPKNDIDYSRYHETLKKLKGE